MAEPLTVSRKGWVVIPAELRRKYGIRPGSQVRVVDYGGVIALVPLSDDPIQRGAGTLKAEFSLTAVLLAEHQAELAGEG